MLKLTNINTNIFEWAINFSGERSELSIKFPKLSKWINRDDYPTVRQLEKFSKATNVPFGYFFLEEPPAVSLPIPFLRTGVDKPQASFSFSPELFDTIRIVEQRQAWFKEYLINNSVEPLNFVGSQKLEYNYKAVAEEIRIRLNLDEKWASKQPNWETALGYLIEKTEKVGINVIRNGIVGNNTHRKLNYKEFRGFVLVDKFAPFIFINGADFKAAQMFSLAHELAHIWLGSSAIFDLRQLQPADDKTEQFCDKIAAELLVPVDYLNQEWNKFKKTENPYQALARSFKVSELVAARRIFDLDLITKDDFFEFYNEYISRKREKRKEDGGGDFYMNQKFRIGKRFAKNIITAAEEGYLLYREAYRLTGLTAKTFQKFEKKILTD